MEPTNENEMKKMRVRYNFNQHYEKQGGVDRLMELVNDCALLDEMAKTFPVTPARLSQVLEIILGVPYSVWLAQHGVSRKKVPGAK